MTALPLFFQRIHMKSESLELRTVRVSRKVTIRHRSKVKTWRDKVTLAAALAELGGDPEANIGRLRTGQTLKRQRMIGKSFPLYVRLEYTEIAPPLLRVHRIRLGIDPMLSRGPTL
jgi:hypothetical protein